MKILLDTGFLFALEVRNDKYHQRAKELSKDFEWDVNEFFTSSLVVNETYTLMNARTRGDAEAIRNLGHIFWSDDCFFNIIYLNKEEYNQISEIMYKYTSPKKIISFVDASLIYLNNTLKCNSIFSFDDHFDNILNRLY